MIHHTANGNVAADALPAGRQVRGRTARRRIATKDSASSRRRLQLEDYVTRPLIHHDSDRRRIGLRPLLALAALFLALPALAQLDNAIDPANLGKGDWIWEMSACQTALGVATPQQVVAYEAGKGMQWITVKGADGGNTNSFTQFNGALISQAHAAGLKIFAWAYCYGNYSNGATVQGEVNAALYLLGMGADGFIIDAETEYEGQQSAAVQYCQAIRAKFPTRFLAYAPFPIIPYHLNFPYVQFGAYCNAVMPQDYWADIGISVSQMVADTDNYWSTNAWLSELSGATPASIKPIAPIGQGWSTTGYTPGTDITTFVNLLKSDAHPAVAGGYQGVSFWSCQAHGPADWAAIGQATIGLSSNNPPLITAPPASLTVARGSSATFTVSAAGAGPLAFQWQFDGAAISGASQSSYTLNNVQSPNAGRYSVAVSNPKGATPSAPAFLSVIQPLTNAPGCIPAPAGLLNWWPGDGNGVDIFSGNNAVAAGGLSYTNGQTGLAFNFDGSTAYLALTNKPVEIPVPWTACFWVNRQATPQNSAALISDGTYALKLEQYNNTHEVGITQLGQTDWVFTNQTCVVPIGSWTHLAFVASGTTTTLWVNGVLTGIIATNLPLGRTTLGAQYVSSSGLYVDYLAGSLDEIMLFDQALAGAQIAALYGKGSAGLCRTPQIVSLVPLPDGSVALNLEGLTGKWITLAASTDLINWVALTNVFNSTGVNQFIDTTAPASPWKFYWVTQPY